MADEKFKQVDPGERTVFNGGFPSNDWLAEKAEHAVEAVVSCISEARKAGRDLGSLHTALCYTLTVASFVVAECDEASGWDWISRLEADPLPVWREWQERWGVKIGDARRRLDPNAPKDAP